MKIVTVVQTLYCHILWHKSLASQKVKYLILRLILEMQATCSVPYSSPPTLKHAETLKSYYNKTYAVSTKVTSSVGCIICIYLSI